MERLKAKDLIQHMLVAAMSLLDFNYGSLAVSHHEKKCLVIEIKKKAATVEITSIQS